MQDDLINEYVLNLIDSFLLDGILDMHRAIKLGYFHLVAPSLDEIEESLNELGSGQGSGNKSHNFCRCIKCKCKVAGTRYASHLSNCMGLGRNSSRRANKRIAEQQRLEDCDYADDDYYIDSSPASGSGTKGETSDKSSLLKKGQAETARLVTTNNKSAKCDSTSKSRQLCSKLGSTSFEHESSLKNEFRLSLSEARAPDRLRIIYNEMDTLRGFDDSTNNKEVDIVSMPGKKNSGTSKRQRSQIH